MHDAFVEAGVGGHIDNATQAWVFDLDHWGTCGQGDDEAASLADLARRTGDAKRGATATHSPTEE